MNVIFIGLTQKNLIYYLKMVDEKELKPFDLRHYPIVPLVGVGVLLIRDNSLLLVKRMYDPDAGY